MEEVFHGPLAPRLCIREWTHPQRSGDISWLIAINMGDLSEKKKDQRSTDSLSTP